MVLRAYITDCVRVAGNEIRLLFYYVHGHLGQIGIRHGYFLLVDGLPVCPMEPGVFPNLNCAMPRAQSLERIFCEELLE